MAWHSRRLRTRRAGAPPVRPRPARRRSTWPRGIQVTFAWAPFRDELWDRSWEVEEFPTLILTVREDELLRDLCDRALEVFAKDPEWEDPRVGGDYFIALLKPGERYVVDLGTPEYFAEPLMGVRRDGSLIIEDKSLKSITVGDVDRGCRADYTRGSVDRIVIHYPQGLGGGPIEVADTLMQFLENLGVLVTTGVGARWAWARRRRPRQWLSDREARRTAQAWREGNINSPTQLRQWIYLHQKWDPAEVAIRLSVPEQTAEALLDALGYEHDRRSARWVLSDSPTAQGKQARWIDEELKLLKSRHFTSANGILAKPESGAQICFLCEEPLLPENRSLEHVIPKWALRRFRLYDARGLLPNSTTIRYKDRTVPTCTTCNAWLDRTLEKPMSAAVRTGKDPDPLVAYLWMMKLYLGARVLETRLAVNRRQADEGTMRSEDSFDLLAAIRTALIAGPEGILKPPPGSLLVFPAGQPADPALGWDMYIPHDDHRLMAGVRIGPWAFVASFLDGGWLLDAAEAYFGAPPEMPLHPAQVFDYFASSDALLSSIHMLTVGHSHTAGERIPGRLNVAFSAQVEILSEPASEADWNELRIATLLDLLHQGKGIGTPSGPFSPDIARDDPTWRIPIGRFRVDGTEDAPITCHETICPAFYARIGIVGSHTCEECGARSPDTP